MSETKESGDKTLGGARPKKTLSLKRTEAAGQVRQSFSHGRSRSVVVEKKKKRTISAPGGMEGEVETLPAAVPAQAQRAEPAQPVAKMQPVVVHKAPEPRREPTPPAVSKVLRTLSNDERAARSKALEAARVRELEERARAEEEERVRAIEAAAAAKRAEEEALLRAAEEAERQRAQDIENKRARAEGRDATVLAPQPVTPAVVAKAAEVVVPPVVKDRPDARKPRLERTPDETVVSRTQRRDQVEDEERPVRKPGVGAPIKRAKPERVGLKREEGRVKGRLTVNNAFDENQRERSLASWKRQIERQKSKAAGVLAQREKIQREVVIPEAITIQELANRMAERGVDIIKFLMKQGDMRKITDVIDADTAELIATEFGHNVKRVSEADVEEGFIGEQDADEQLKPRAPVVTIMGHVDHGKTSLLDAIRQTDVASGEAGGITQHIGAYQVEISGGRKITFIDTPGHEAFTAMRARGAKVTDIVILVVAADDGVMPQTIEAINHAKVGGVPLIVAINKIDKPGADPMRVKTDLLQHGIVVESMSGETLEVEVSAIKKTNLDKLLEAIMLQSELLELKANPDRSAEGVVIEAKLEAGRGPVGTVLIQRGTLHVGDIIVAGTAWGRVRALQSDRGEPIETAGPSVPVEVLGFSSAPEAGDLLAVVENEARARELVDYRARERKKRTAPGVGTGGPRTLEQMMSQLKEQGRKELPLVVKGDVQGSVEAINAALAKLGNDEVAARVIHSGVGGITESDVSLAATAGAVILAFNVRANAQARASTERLGVEVRQYSIIYDLVDDVKKAMSGMLAPTQREIFLGNATILQVFDISKVGKVAGCRVTEGKVERGARVRLIRDNVVVHEGKLSTLKRFKDEVKEVPAGQECGMAFESYKDMREGDVIECFNVEVVIRTL
jgi:translation initiation factor IF-2